VALSHNLLADWRRRRAGRRWQRWTEIAPEDDLLRRARFVTSIFVVIMLVVFIGIVVGLILALA
jgi:hypothetical protein